MEEEVHSVVALLLDNESFLFCKDWLQRTMLSANKNDKTSIETRPYPGTITWFVPNMMQSFLKISLKMENSVLLNLERNEKKCFQYYRFNDMQWS